MFSVNVPVAFVGGLISFFAPCILPLLPAYIGYIAGISTEKGSKGFKKSRRKIFVSSLFYVAGFSTIFVVFGSVAGEIGVLLQKYGFILQRVGGGIILILGLEFAGILNLPFLAREAKLKLPTWTASWGYARSFLVGVIFAAAWTPCVGAVLGAILTLAAVSQTAQTGAWLLFVYSLGISLPFLLVSLTISSLEKYLPTINKFTKTIALVSGILLAILGILLLTDTYHFVNSWFLQLAFHLGYRLQCVGG